MSKLELIKCWKVNPEGNISEKDATLTRRLSRWPNKKNLVPFLISVLRLYQMCSNPKHITCFEVLIQPWVPLKRIFSLGILFLTVVSLALLLLTRLMRAFTPNSTQLTLTVCDRVFIVKQLQGTFWIKHKIFLVVYISLFPAHLCF